MAAITQRVENFLGGVSRQSDDKKAPGQVTELINGYPDPTFGLTKRAGFKWIANLSGTGVTTYDNAKWFYINRDQSERYIGCITIGDPGTIMVWNVDGTACTVDTASVKPDYLKSDSRDNYHVITAQDTSIITNSSITVKERDVEVDDLNLTKSKATILFNGPPFELDNNATPVTYTLKFSTEDDPVIVQSTTTLDSIDTFSITGGETGSGRTAGTYTFQNIAGDGSGTGADFEVVIADDGKATVTKTDQGGGYAVDETITLPNIDNFGGGTDIELTVTAVNTTQLHTFEKILQKLKEKIEALGKGYSCTVLDDTLEIEKTTETEGETDFTLTVKAGRDGKKLSVIRNEVINLTYLPVKSIHNRKIEITNTAADQDNFWVKFIDEDGVEGEGIGHWEETRDPKAHPGLNKDTMPHELVNTSLNNFVLKPIAYADRLTGTGDTSINTNPAPSFVNSTISQSFFQNNRLGFLSEDNVILSKASDFYNFYYTTAQTITAADPIDIPCSTTRPVKLHGVVPTTQGTILFSNNQQFVMKANDGLFTPRTTSIRAISNYETDSKTDPVDMGTHINFISKTPSYTRVFSMITKGQEDNPSIVDVGKVVNEWIPPTVDTLVSNPQNGILALSDQDSKTIYLNRIHIDGDKVIMQAWFKWELCGKVQTLFIDDDDIYAVTIQGNAQYTLSSASISQSPEDAIIVNTNGVKVNPCIDLYAQASSVIHTPVESITIANGGDYTGCTLTAATINGNLGSGSGAVLGVPVVEDNVITSIPIINHGSNYYSGAEVTINLSSGSPVTNAVVEANVYKGSWCYFPKTGSTYLDNDETLTSCLIIKGGGEGDASLWKESGFAILPTIDKDSNNNYYAKVPNKNLVSQAADVFLGWQYDFDVHLPKTYFRLADQNRATDVSASLMVARMKFSSGLSGVLSFKLKTKGTIQGSRLYIADGITDTFGWIDEDINNVSRDEIKVKINDSQVSRPTDWDFVDDNTIKINTIQSNELKADGAVGARHTFKWTFDRINLDRIKVRTSTSGSGTTEDPFVWGPEKVRNTDFISSLKPISVTAEDHVGEIVFVEPQVTELDGDTVYTLAPKDLPLNTGVLIYSADEILIYEDEWYRIRPIQFADDYLVSDVPLADHNVFTVPIHQRSKNFQLRIYNDSPFPVALNSMMWEGNYSPRQYRRM